ncbi:MAG: hypothetical protein J7K53_00200 [Bacteroidales bacterium]|nr:hypothetical protein [Bacteroidales bacterium]
MDIPKPGVNNNILIGISAIMWSAIGILLNYFAVCWFNMLSNIEIIIAIVGGIFLGVIIAITGFRKIARKNIYRIKNLPENACVFAFQSWKSYLLIAVMVSMGVFLRKTDYVPRLFLAPVYIGLGLALFGSSLEYYYNLIMKR